jgi:hypothetical protein
MSGRGGYRLSLSSRKRGGGVSGRPPGGRELVGKIKKCYQPQKRKDMKNLRISWIGGHGQFIGFAILGLPDPSWRIGFEGLGNVPSVHNHLRSLPGKNTLPSILTISFRVSVLSSSTKEIFVTPSIPMQIPHK